MNYLPIFIDITQKPCLVIGGGDIAYRKIKLLLKQMHKCIVFLEYFVMASVS